MQTMNRTSTLSLAIEGSRRLNLMQEEIRLALLMMRTESSPEIIRKDGILVNGVHAVTIKLIDPNGEDFGQLKVSWFNSLPFFKAEVSCGEGSRAFRHMLISGDNYRPIKYTYVPLIWNAMQEVLDNAEEHLHGLRQKLDFYRTVALS